MLVLQIKSLLFSYVKKLLLAAGASVKGTNNQGRTALMNASRLGFWAIVQVITFYNDSYN